MSVSLLPLCKMLLPVPAWTEFIKAANGNRNLLKSRDSWIISKKTGLKKKSLLHKSLVFILAQRRELKSVGESVEEPRLQMKEEKLHLKEKKKRKRATKN